MGKFWNEKENCSKIMNEKFHETWMVRRKWAWPERCLIRNRWDFNIAQNPNQTTQISQFSLHLENGKCTWEKTRNKNRLFSLAQLPPSPSNFTFVWPKNAGYWKMELERVLQFSLRFGWARFVVFHSFIFLFNYERGLFV